MTIRYIFLSCTLLTGIGVAFFGFTSCGDDTKTDDTPSSTATTTPSVTTPTAITSAFTTQCTTCHDADGIGGALAPDADLVAYTKANSYATYLNIIRTAPPTGMTTISASQYADAAAKSDYAFFKAQ